MSVPTPETVVEALSNIVAEDEEEEGTAQEEVETVLQKVPAITTPGGRINRFIVLAEVVQQSLVPCLIATPFVYLSETDWSFASHADFRRERRKQLDEILAPLKSKVIDMDNDELIPLINKFEDILKDIFRVRIPAMPSYYITENYYDTVGASEVAEELIKNITDAGIFDAKTRLQNLTKVLLRWFLLCPVGRPQVYANDDGWSTVSEKELRASYRDKLLDS